jgi:hypothetical protein
MRAILPCLLAVLLITAWGGSKAKDPVAVLQNEDFGLGIHIMGSKDCLKKLPPYDLALTVDPSTDRVTYFFTRNGKGRRTKVGPKTPYVGQILADMQSDGQYLEVTAQGDRIDEIKFDNHWGAGVPSNVTFQGVQLRGITIKRVAGMFPWSEKKSSTFAGRKEDFFFYENNNIKLPDGRRGNMHFSAYFVDGVFISMWLTAYPDLLGDKGRF